MHEGGAILTFLQQVQPVYTHTYRRIRTVIIHTLAGLHNRMDDKNADKKRKVNFKCQTSYSNITEAEAEKRLNIRFDFITQTPIEKVQPKTKCLAKGLTVDVISKTKQKVYDQIVQYLLVEGFPNRQGFPIEASSAFKESSINHLVYATISPILADFIRITGHDTMRLWSEKELIARDGETGGMQDFVVVDVISVTEETYVLVVEAKRSFVGKAMRQCLLAMKDMRDNNGKGTVYGFTTTGVSWQMIIYDFHGHRGFQGGVCGYEPKYREMDKRLLYF
ncbi:hypothetical protein BDZ91DRAFT_710578, partial [Kalaharituber pfeilii]